MPKQTVSSTSVNGSIPCMAPNRSTKARIWKPYCCSPRPSLKDARHRKTNTQNKPRLNVPILHIVQRNHCAYYDNLCQNKSKVVPVVVKLTKYLEQIPFLASTLRRRYRKQWLIWELPTFSGNLWGKHGLKYSCKHSCATSETRFVSSGSSKTKTSYRRTLAEHHRKRNFWQKTIRT